MATNFVISVRKVKGTGEGAEFVPEPGVTRYLEVPDRQTPHPMRHKVSRTEWVKQVVARAGRDKHRPIPRRGEFSTGDILVFVHGYNNSMEAVMRRHDLLQKRLGDLGFQGAIVSYDWPSAEATLNYLEDRSDARETARRLVEDGIKVLAMNQRDEYRAECDIDVHLLGHSTGAYVIREAFYDARQSRQISRINWNVSQIVLIGGDIARESLSRDDKKSSALFRHSARITNYQNPYDSALKVSNVKRLGAAPRVGRVGLPKDAPDTIVNVNVGKYWRALDQDESEAGGNWSHSWHFDDPVFASDLLYTLQGDLDRHVIPTRTTVDGALHLTKED